MKQLIDIFLIFLSSIILAGCSNKVEVSPSQNSALNSISTSNADTKKGSLQNNLDNFINGEWFEAIGNDKEIQKKYEEKEERDFTLQEYVDKAAAYKKVHPSDHEHSNIHKLESIPVIGSTKSR